MSQGKQFNIALSDWQVSEIERQAKLLGIKRTELVVRWITSHIREEHEAKAKPVFTEQVDRPASVAVKAESDSEIDDMIAKMFKGEGT